MQNALLKIVNRILISSIDELEITLATVKQFQNENQKQNEFVNQDQLSRELIFTKDILKQEYDMQNIEFEYIEEVEKQYQDDHFMECNEKKKELKIKNYKKNMKQNLEEQKRKFNYVKKFRQYLQQKHEKQIQYEQKLKTDTKKQSQYKVNLEQYFEKNNLPKKNQDDVFIFSQLSFNIFDQIRAEYLKTGDTVSKSNVTYYFLTSKNLLKMFDIYPHELIEEILNFESIEPNFLCDNDLCQILALPRRPIDLNRIKYFQQTNPHKIIQEFFMYFFVYEQQKLQNIQNKIYEYKKRTKTGIELLIYQLEQYLQDFQNLDILNEIVYYIYPINKVITISHLILQYRQRIIDNKIYNDQDQIQEDFLSFVMNFELNNKQKFFDLSLFMSYKNNSQDNYVKFNHMEIFKDIFQKLPQVDGYVIKDELFTQIKNCQFLDNKMHKIVRKISEEDQELLHELLDRIDRESDEYINYDEFQQYFTQRGYPIFSLKYYKQRNCEENDKKDLKKENKIYLWTLPNSKARKEHLRKIWSSKHFEQIYGKNNLKRKFNKDLNITIPKDLKIGQQSDKLKYYQIFQDYLQNLKEKDEQEKLQFKFRAKQVPKNIHKNIYEKMNEKEQLKKEQWKMQQEEIENMRAENLRQLKEEKEQKEEEEFIIPKFRARQMPKYCNDGLFQELIQDKIDERKKRKQELKEIIREKQDVPFYQHMPKRFQKYAKKQHQKQLYYKNMSADKYDPECTFIPKISKQINQSYKQYFENLQDKFKQKAQHRQAEIVNQMEEEYDQKYRPFNFKSNFEKRGVNTHNCRKQQQIKDVPFVYDYKKILYEEVPKPQSTIKYDQMKQKNLNKKNNKNIQKLSNSCDSFYRAEIITGNRKSHQADYLVRNILIPKEDFENCHYRIQLNQKKILYFQVLINFTVFLINIKKTYAETKQYRRIK